MLISTRSAIEDCSHARRKFAINVINVYAYEHEHKIQMRKKFELLRTTDSTTDRPKNRPKGAGRREKLNLREEKESAHEREATDTKGRMLRQVWLLFSKEADV